MKRSITLCVLLIILTICVPAFSEVNMEYDRFKQRTEVSVSPRVWGPGFSVFVLKGTYPAKTPSIPPTVILGIYTSNKSGWKYLGCHSVDCLADEKPFDLPSFKHEGRVIKSGHVREFVYTAVPFNVVESLAKHVMAEFRVCRTVFTLTADGMKDVRAFIRAFK